MKLIQLKHSFTSVILLPLILVLVLLPCYNAQVDPENLEQIELEPGFSNNVLVVAVGDVMLSRMVGEHMELENDPMLPFRETADILREADITFCNLESPFYKERPPEKGEMVFGASPDTVQGLKYAGFDIISLANNHFGDQGQDNMLFTLRHLTGNGIQYTGAGENDSLASEPAYIERNGVKFAFLAYNDINSSSKQRYGVTSSKPGTALLTEKGLMEDIREARTKAHVVVVSIHWGTEYEEIPTERQRTFAHMAIDSGALLVIGHHPHVIQPVEEYGDGYIFYSLGNFVFDQMWSDNTTKSLIVRILFEGNTIKEVETIKAVINESFQPCLEDWE